MLPRMAARQCGALTPYVTRLKLRTVVLVDAG